MNSRMSAWNVSTPATNVAGIIADVLWMLAYICTIRIGFRDHTYGVPLVAVCLNFSWEFVFSLIIRPKSKLRMGLTLLWLAIDCVIVYQLFRYGRADQIAQLQPYFVPIVIGTMVLAIIGHITFYRTYEDPGGQEDAFAINLIMSILFVFLFFSRPDMRGLSYAAAWLKMIGTGILSAGNFWLMRKEEKKYGFFIFLFGTIFLFDVIYVSLLWHARHAGS
jgi:hypothetical protein